MAWQDEHIHGLVGTLKILPRIGVDLQRQKPHLRYLIESVAVRTVSAARSRNAPFPQPT
jgi:hypothetical protein